MKYIFLFFAILFGPFLLLIGLIYFIDWFHMVGRDKLNQNKADNKKKSIQSETGNKEADLYEYEKKRNKAAYEAKARRKREIYYSTPEESRDYIDEENFVSNKNYPSLTNKEKQDRNKKKASAIKLRREREENYKKYLVSETNQERIERKNAAEKIYERRKLNTEREQNLTNYGISETNAERKKRKEEELTLKRNRMKKSLDEEKKIIIEEEALKNAERIANERLEQKINISLYGKNNTNSELVRSGFLKKIWSPKEKKYIYDANFKYEEYKKHTKEEISKYWEKIINEPKVSFWNETDENKINPCPKRCKSKEKETKWLYKNLKRAILESHTQQEPYYCPSGFGYHIRTVKK